MRKALVEHDYVDCMVQLTGQLFANAQIPCSLWFLSKNRKGGNRYRKRTGEVLFIDGRKLGTLIPGSRKQKHVDRMKRLVFSLRLKSAFQQRGAQATTSLRRPGASSYLRVRRILAARYEPTPNSAGPSWLTALGHAKDSLWSVDLFRCESAVLHTYWVLVVMDHWTRRIVGFGVHRGVVEGVALCRMFNHATRGESLPTYLSADHDPLYRFHQWQANLRILNIREIKRCHTCRAPSCRRTADWNRAARISGSPPVLDRG